MNKFVYVYTYGDEYSGFNTNCITFESESKNDLVTELGCVLIDFNQFRIELNNMIKKLRQEKEKLYQEQDITGIRIYNEKIIELSASSKKFVFKGRAYLWENFVEVDGYGNECIVDLDYSIELLDSFFERHLGVLVNDNKEV